MYRIALLAVLPLGLSVAGFSTQPADLGAVEITVLDKNSGEPVPCRIHLKDEAGKPQRAPKLPFWHDHFVCSGKVQLELAPGKYTFEIERGPEYRLESGSFTIQAKAVEKRSVKLERLANLASQGWWSGELHVHRPIEEIELLMQAEDLHVAPVITWWNNRNRWDKEKPPANPLVKFDRNRYYHVLAGEDERGRRGAALLPFGPAAGHRRIGPRASAADEVRGRGPPA